MSETKSKRMFIVMYILIISTLLLMSSCGSTKEIKKCCEKTVNEVYKYEKEYIK